MDVPVGTGVLVAIAVDVAVGTGVLVALAVDVAVGTGEEGGLGVSGSDPRQADKLNAIIRRKARDRRVPTYSFLARR